ncbi:MAG: hypothetical protein ACK50J_03170 [Planctomyces sp.]
MEPVAVSAESGDRNPESLVARRQRITGTSAVMLSFIADGSDDSSTFGTHV